MKEVIRLDNIRRDFVVGDEVVHALRGISLTITEGEFVTIMGTSGFTSHGRGRMIRGFRMPLVTMAPMRTATRTAAPQLARLWNDGEHDAEQDPKSGPTSLVLV